MKYFNWILNKNILQTNQDLNAASGDRQNKEISIDQKDLKVTSSKILSNWTNFTNFIYKLSLLRIML